MSFTSYSYLAFLAFAVLTVRLTSRRHREYVLLLLSLFYYATWNVYFVALLLGLGAFTYVAGHRVIQTRGSLRTLLLPIIGILAVLAFFKYAGMFIELADWILPRSSAILIPSIILPLGISFYTFECISYLLDLYKKGGQEIRPFYRFLLFPSFWPHMVAGPILRVKEFAPQLDTLQTANTNELLLGFERVLVGLIKKMVLANSLAPLVDLGFSEGALRNSSLDNWVVASAFGLQIYFDFSSYTDIAIGSARMVGFKFPENFNLPYHAKNPSEFWNRWHMTLSRWIRDYLFFPLNMRAGKRIWLRYVSLVGVMAVVGLWHGAGLVFILWGVWHGFLMVGHRVIAPWFKKLPERFQPTLALLGQATTLGLVTAGWILFRAPSIGQAARMLTSMFGIHGLKPAYSVNDYLIVLFCVFEYAAVEPLFLRLAQREPSALNHVGWSFWLRPAAYVAAFDLVFMFDKSNVAFIYFQF